MFSNPVILWKGKIECYKANVTIGLGPWTEKKKKKTVSYTTVYFYNLWDRVIVLTLKVGANEWPQTITSDCTLECVPVANYEQTRGFT